MLSCVIRDLNSYSVDVLSMFEVIMFSFKFDCVTLVFFLGVDDSMNTAKDAIASLYRLPKKLIPHIKSISRQGKR